MDRIYEKESFAREWDTVVSGFMEYKGKPYIRFEETIFMPNEGGQYADTGEIIIEGRTVKVINGIKINKEIWYEISEPVSVGSQCHCRIDWNQRFDRMQQHTGEHILTGLINRKYGYDNIGFHLSDDSPVTLVMSGALSWEEALEIEEAANQIIYEDLPVRDLYPSKEELLTMEYRSKIEIEGQVRIIRIGEEDAVDLCACCAPHVHHTGQIGIIKLLWAIPYKGGTQIGMLAGRRGSRYIREKLELLDQIARGFSTASENVPDCIKTLREREEGLKKQCSALWEEKIKLEIEQLLPDKESCIFVDSEIPQSNMKIAYNMLLEKYKGFTGIFTGSDEGGYRYYCGSRELDSCIAGKALRDTLGAKGGGNREMQQGVVKASKTDIENLFGAINENNQF